MRYGYLFGALSTAGSLNGERLGQLASPQMLAPLVDLCTYDWQELLNEVEQPHTNDPVTTSSRARAMSRGP